MPGDLTPFASRLRPARPDLAAAHLRGQVAAARFVEGAPRRVTAALLDLTLSPEPGAGLATQLLHGEGFTVYETRDGMAWGQAASDGYVGYVAAAGLGDPQPSGRRVTALWAQVYPRPEVKARTVGELPFLAEVAVAEEAAGSFAGLAGGGYVAAPHLAPVAGDAADQAERFVGVPYLWGGRSARGIDCSGLVQLALMATGVAAPRDSDMQQALLGTALEPGVAARRGDLVFWNGHVGILRDPATLIHANGHHMAVAVEPLAGAVARIAAAGGGPVAGRRRVAPG